MERNKQFYEPPQLTVVEFKVERGYAESGLASWTSPQRLQTFIDDQMLIADDLTSDGQLVAGYLENEDYTNPTASTGWQFEDGSYF